MRIVFISMFSHGPSSMIIRIILMDQSEHYQPHGSVPASFHCIITVVQMVARDSNIPRFMSNAVHARSHFSVPCVVDPGFVQPFFWLFVCFLATLFSFFPPLFFLQKIWSGFEPTSFHKQATWPCLRVPSPLAPILNSLFQKNKKFLQFLPLMQGGGDSHQLQPLGSNCTGSTSLSVLFHSGHSVPWHVGCKATT